MYEPFPGNYVWNLSVNIDLCMGGVMGEIDPANDAVREIAKRGEDEGTNAFFTAWVRLADRVAGLGRADEAAGHRDSAREKYRRAVGYYVTAERMESRHYAPRREAYRTMLETAGRMLAVDDLGAERVEIAYEGSSFPAIFVPGAGEGPRPCMVFCNGLDSVKEMIFLSVLDTFRRRGIACLMVDQPGVGEALRLNGLPAVIEAERWAGPAIDYLEGRADVDLGRIGMMGWSLGGYFAPRAAAFEQRFKLCVAWGANHEWGELQRRRAAREGDRPVPHYWDHVMWVWNQPDVDSFLTFADAITLTGAVERIRVPFLITHGANDRQIPIDYAHRSYEQAVNSPRRELKIFTAKEGGVEHCSADNMEPVRSFIADWLAARFAESGADI